MATLLADKYATRKAEVNERFEQLRANEEELNRIFAEIYNMVGEVPIEVEDKYVSVRKADLQREIKSLLSYAVGCMMGRYSLDEDGLILADQGATEADYLARIPDPTYPCDDDGIIPVTDDDYFGDDDIVAHTVAFVKAAYGEETLEQNLRYIADALGGEGKPARDVIRSYFLKDFFKDHCQIYKKRPIYWLFDSGKKNGFKCLIYMHRYTPEMIARIRTEYIHPQQQRYRSQIEFCESQLESASGSQRMALQKRVKKLQDQLKEASDYEQEVAHYAEQMIAIDLDDGVKVNYAKFGDLLAKIK